MASFYVRIFPSHWPHFACAFPMGTKGIYGFEKGGVRKVTYNHYDSYPTSLGVRIVDALRDVSLRKLNAAFDNIIIVAQKATPTEAQIAKCQSFAEGNLREWYWLLHRAQGNLALYINGALRHMIDPNDLLGSGMCEWAYIVNLDSKSVDVYAGVIVETQDRHA